MRSYGAVRRSSRRLIIVLSTVTLLLAGGLAGVPAGQAADADPLLWAGVVQDADGRPASSADVVAYARPPGSDMAAGNALVAVARTTTDTAGRQFLRTADGLPIFAAASDDDFDAVPLMRWILAFSHNAQNKFAQFKAAGHGTNMFAVEKGLEPMIVEWFEKTLRNAPAKIPVMSSSAGKPSPQEEFWSLLEESGGAARAMQYYEEMKKRDPSVVLFPEFAVNALGYERLQDGKAAEAVEIFKINVAAYPASPNVYDSLGDAYVAAGNRELAIEASRKTIQMLDATPGLDEQFRKLLRESAEGKLRQLGAPPAAPPKQ